MAKDKIFESLDDGHRHTLRVERRGDAYEVHADGHGMTVADVGGGNWLVSTSAGSVAANVEVRDSEVEVTVVHERFRFRALDGSCSGAARRGSATGRAEVTAPMPGKVIKLLASVGDRVQAGQGVLLFEAMKMQNEIRSPRAGKLHEIAVKPEQAVVSRERLFVVEADE